MNMTHELRNLRVTQDQDSRLLAKAPPSLQLVPEPSQTSEQHGPGEFHPRAHPSYSSPSSSSCRMIGILPAWGLWLNPIQLRNSLEYSRPSRILLETSKDYAGIMFA